MHENIFLLYLWLLDCYFTYVKFFGHPNYSRHNAKKFLELIESNLFLVFFLVHFSLSYLQLCLPKEREKKLLLHKNASTKGPLSLNVELSSQTSKWLLLISFTTDFRRTNGHACQMMLGRFILDMCRNTTRIWKSPTFLSSIQDLRSKCVVSKFGLT
jgi:hypothetical protein